MDETLFQPDLLAGRTALVTGGATGIGQAISRRLGQLGAKVVIASRNPESLAAAAAGFAADDGLDIAWKRLDVREDAMVKAVIDEVAEAHGGLDILVNNARQFLCPTADLSANGWRAVIDIDLNGTFYCCRHAYPHLKAAPTGGRIISISTTRANSGWPGAAHAGAAKAGIQSLMRALAVEWGADGIRANFISPGPIAGTVGVQKLYEDRGRGEEIRQQVPLGRYGEGMEIANAVAYLACRPPAPMSPAPNWRSMAAGNGISGFSRLFQDPVQRQLAEAFEAAFGDHHAVAKAKGQAVVAVAEHGVGEKHHARFQDQRVAGIDHRRHIHPTGPESGAEGIAAGGVAVGAVAGGVKHLAMGGVDGAERPTRNEGRQHRHHRFFDDREHGLLGRACRPITIGRSIQQV